MGDTARAKATAAAAEQQKKDQEQRAVSAVAVGKLLEGKTTAPEIAAVIRAHPRYEQDFMDFLNAHFGNAFVMNVWDELDKIDATAKPTTDAVSDIRNLSDLNSVPETAQPATMPVEDKRSDRLPYDGRGGWDAVQINTKLGQWDKIAGTDNDDDRCAYATIMAAKVFDGPQVFGTWLSVFRDERGGGGRFFLPKQQAAAKVIEVVAKAIKDGTATYRDMSWLQEALYDYAITALNNEWKNKEGVQSTSEITSKTTETVVAGSDDQYTTPEKVISHVKDLKPGSNMMVEWAATNPDGKGMRHEMMISNHDGKLYLYDASGTIDGTYLHELTPGHLRLYFEGAGFTNSTMKLASTVTGKKGLPTD